VEISVGALFDKQYNYSPGLNNGNVMSITNVKDNTRSQAFTYDPLNRLTSAWDTSHWGNAYSYDSWGNLLQKNLMSGKPAGENQVVNADAYNHLIGYSYDAAGNMTHDATNGLNYNYDQENRITGTAAYTYLYDGGGNRVRKVSGSESTTYWYASPGIIAESDASGNFTDYIFWAGQRLARNVNGDIKYYVTDHLHSTDMFVDKTGAVLDDQDFYPWGGTVPGVGVSTSNNHYKFTGKERDSESGLDYFGARYYSNGLGRFITPDWAAKATAVPYAEFADPQSLNLYTYVRNIPTTKVDADGHCVWDLCIAETAVVITVGEILTAAGIGAALGVTAAGLQSAYRNRGHNNNTLTGRGGHHSSAGKLHVPKGNPAPGTQTKAGNTVKPYETGTYKDLKGRSTAGDGLDIHHVPQAGQAEQVIPGYDRITGPAIAVPEAEHVSIPTMKGAATNTAEEQVNKDVQDLRTHTNAPEEAVRQAEKNAKEIIPKKQPE